MAAGCATVPLQLSSQLMHSQLKSCFSLRQYGPPFPNVIRFIQRSSGDPITEYLFQAMKLMMKEKATIMCAVDDVTIVNLQGIVIIFVVFQQTAIDKIQGKPMATLNAAEPPFSCTQGPGQQCAEKHVSYHTQPSSVLRDELRQWEVCRHMSSAETTVRQGSSRLRYAW